MDCFDSFTLAPLSAGDIIDRAVRLYRRHFMTLLRIVLAPSLIAYAGGIASTIGWRNLWLKQGDREMILNGALLVAGLGVYFIGKVAFFVMLGGTSRALVNYFLGGSPLRARDVYRAVRERLWSLVGATLIVLVLLMAVFWLIYTVVALTAMAYMLGSLWLLREMPSWVQMLFHGVFAMLLAGVLLTLALLIYGRIIYVPQALMVEGKGVFSALGRSFALAGRDVRRIGVIFIFDLYVTWSVLFLLIIPLGWYASLNGVDVTPFGPEKPLWYNISYQTITQLSEILLAPIALLGFTLLYIDSRVRKEGFDIELLANRQLPAAGLVAPSEIIAPSAPLANSSFPSILGLNGYPAAPAAPAAEINTERRTCQSCGIEAGPEDLFCRTCGALYQQELEVGDKQ